MSRLNSDILNVFQKVTENIREFSIILLDRNGIILFCNKGVERIKGYAAKELIGQHFNMFYLPEDRQQKLPERLLAEALEKGNSSYVGKRIRKNGSLFWGKVELTAIKDDHGTVIGFVKVANPLSNQTEIGDFWFDVDGVLHTRLTSDVQTPEQIHSMRELVEEAIEANGGKLCIIADISKYNYTDEARSFNTASAMKKHYKAVALVTQGCFPEKKIESMLQAVTPFLPCKVFQNNMQAKTWIKQYL
jgi:PAS domain S-box-containing protein